jgi:hypothetical protein
MRLTYFYLISALGGSIGLLEVRHEIEHRKQARLVSEILYLTEQSIKQTGPLLNVLSEHTSNFKKLGKHKKIDILELRDKYNVLSSLDLQYKTKMMIDDHGINPFAINHVHTTLKDADALLNRMVVIVNKEVKPIERTTPFPFLRDAQLQYPVGRPMQGKLDMFWPVREELHFTQLVVDGKTIASPKFPIHVQHKSEDIELTVRNPVTQEEMKFRNTWQ